VKVVDPADVNELGSELPGRPQGRAKGLFLAQDLALIRCHNKSLDQMSRSCNTKSYKKSPNYLFLSIRINI
jgi:hypothetical protein